MLSRPIPKVFLGADNDSLTDFTTAKLRLKNIIQALSQLEIELLLTPAVFSRFKRLAAETKDIKGVKTAKILFTEDPRRENPDMAIVLDAAYLFRLGAETVPIISLREAEKLDYEEFNPQTEKGRCFCFARFNVWDIFAAVVRAVENYRFPYDWNNLVRSCRTKPTDAKTVG